MSLGIYLTLGLVILGSLLTVSIYISGSLTGLGLVTPNHPELFADGFSSTPPGQSKFYQLLLGPRTTYCPGGKSSPSGSLSNLITFLAPAIIVLPAIDDTTSGLAYVCQSYGLYAINPNVLAYPEIFTGSSRGLTGDLAPPANRVAKVVANAAPVCPTYIVL